MNIEQRLRELSKQGKAARFEADGHWAIDLYEDGTCSWSYTCGCSDECDSYDYYTYKTVEELILDQAIDLNFNWKEI